MQVSHENAAQLALSILTRYKNSERQTLVLQWVATFMNVRIFETASGKKIYSAVHPCAVAPISSKMGGLYLLQAR